MYTPKFFYDNLPSWKKKKDSLIVNIFYRPLSFLTSSLCANCKVKANVVTVFSVFVGIASSALFVFGNYTLAIIGAALLNFWLLLDATDGNLARCVEKQPYGEFLDALGSYVITASMGICYGIYIYRNPGLISSGDYRVLFLILGAFASVFDIAMRLIHQKFVNTTNELIERGVLEKVSTVKKGFVYNVGLRFIMEFGIGGLLPLAVLLSTIFGWLDFVIIYLVVYNFIGFFGVLNLYILKSLKYLNTQLK